MLVSSPLSLARPPIHNLVARHGLSPVFETARMYTGPIRPVEPGNLYGVTSFELG